MAYEIVMGIHVSDDEVYAEYRKAMMSILERYGGAFRWDFEVSGVLITPSESDRDGASINRLFVIRFPDRAARERFFADPGYAEVKKRYFDRSVTFKSIIAEYTTTG